MRIGPLVRVVLLVTDFERSLEFYSERLGLAVRDRRDGWAVLETGEALLCLRGPWTGMEHDPETFGQSSDEVLLLVEDIEAVREELIGRGVEVQPVHEPAPGIRVAEMRDPDGRRVGIEERTR